MRAPCALRHPPWRALALSWVAIVLPLVTVSPSRAAQPTAYGVSAFYYVVPDDRNYLQPTLRADIERAHLEARYNYEGLETVSMWIGYNLSASKMISVEVTPLVGLVFGGPTGIAPGASLSLGWQRFELYTEGEYVYDFDDTSESFFYSWSELTAGIMQRLRGGIAVQRTQTFETPREFQGGVLLGVRVGALELTGHIFDLDLDDRTWVFAASMEF